MPSCPGGGGGGGGSGGGGGGRRGEESVPYAAAEADAVEEVEVDEVKMEAEDHLAREYVQEFVLDHLDPADVKREVSTAYPYLSEDVKSELNLNSTSAGQNRICTEGGICLHLLN